MFTIANVMHRAVKYTLGNVGGFGANMRIFETDLKWLTDIFGIEEDLRLRCDSINAKTNS